MKKNQRMIVTILFLFIGFSLGAETLKLNENGQLLGFKKMGNGPRTVILIPGIGDLKENYFDFAQLLLRDATIYALDLRGLGESSANFNSYGADETGEDIIFFINHYNLKDVTIVANSMSSASAIFAASKLPERIQTIVLTGPFIKDQEIGLILKGSIGLMFIGPWGPFMFQYFYEGLYPVNKPSDLIVHSEKIKANLKEDGRMFAVRSMFYARKTKSAEAIDFVKAKVIIIMGDKDPDFDNPIEEAKELANLTKGNYFIFENCGHYPYKENPKKLKSILDELWQKK